MGGGVDGVSPTKLKSDSDSTHSSSDYVNWSAAAPVLNVVRNIATNFRIIGRNCGLVLSSLNVELTLLTNIDDKFFAKANFRDFAGHFYDSFYLRMTYVCSDVPAGFKL